MKNQRKFLITGGTGTLGYYIEDMLKNHGEVEIFDRSIGDNSKGIEGDIRSENEVIEAIQGKDVVLHLASLTDINQCETNPENCFDVNVKGTYNVCKAAIKEETKLIFFSSREVYGEAISASEDSPIEPKNVYGQSKAASEEIVRQMLEQKLIIRPSNVFGTGEDVISKFSRQINQGEKIQIYSGIKLDLIYIDDFIDILDLMVSKNLEGTYNVGSGQNFTTEEIYGLIEDELDEKVKTEELNTESALTEKFSMSVKKLKSNLDYKIPDQEDRIREVTQDER